MVTASYIACKGDPIANLQEDLAADVTSSIIQQNRYNKMNQIKK